MCYCHQWKRLCWSVVLMSMVSGGQTTDGSSRIQAWKMLGLLWLEIVAHKWQKGLFHFRQQKRLQNQFLWSSCKTKLVTTTKNRMKQWMETFMQGQCMIRSTQLISLWMMPILKYCSTIASIVAPTHTTLSSTPREKFQSYWEELSTIPPQKTPFSTGLGLLLLFIKLSPAHICNLQFIIPKRLL